ncbi:PREDICTED: uracil-DNA glycosylase [Cercocebus atys]|uniref:uracil-DNA glycosylase n=1 Tax=Cercocebus atys TaxID=9531 RepID=UPI0005F57F1B|nr:PREDICTED: uracil-DNA glycosylase [Cercocebus atys]
MIGQKTLYSFFSPSPARKRRAPSPEPAVLGTGVAAVPEENRDAAPPLSPMGRHAEGSANGDAPLRPWRQSILKLLALLFVSRPAIDLCPPTPPRASSSSHQKPTGHVAGPKLAVAAACCSGSGANPAQHSAREEGGLMGFVAEERKHYTVYPPPHQVFTWTQMCDIRDVKVVILGQDPYHGPNQAHGLCFSVQRPVPPPPSLENIYKELSTDIEDFVHPGHGDLSGWAKQGVLLLNAVLTVRAHQANSHKERGWEQFTDAVVSWLNQNSNGLVFLLWGSYAQKKGSAIDRKRHHVLQTAHPSPLSVYRGFFGCRHFSKTNELLQKSGKKPIDWKEL